MDDFQNVYVKDVPMKGKGIFAAVPISSGSLVFPFNGRIVPLDQAGKLSLQINEHEAIDSFDTIDDFLNHSCSPNAKVVIENKSAFLYAIRDIQQDEELSFNYNSTEYDMVAQGCSFQCQCGDVSCLGEIKGFKYLDEFERHKITELLIPYLKESHALST